MANEADSEGNNAAIFAIDDNPVNLELLQAVLEARGYRLSMA